MKLDDAAKFAAANAAIDSLRARCEVASLERPTSLLRCFDDGELDLVELSRHMMKQADAVENKLNNILLGNPQDNEEAGDDNEETPPKKRHKRKPILARRNEDGQLEAITPRESWWYMLYVDCPMLDDDRFHKKFRRRFRLPYEQYRELVNDAVEGNWFPRWMKEESSPIDLLILGSLRYLGRGFTFDDCEENTATSEEVHRVFFHQVSRHKSILFQQFIFIGMQWFSLQNLLFCFGFTHQFINVGSTILFDRYVRTPSNPQEAAAHTVEFEMAGFPGCVGSSDATHITIEKCSQRLRQFHKGGKSKSTTRSHNITVNHRRRILGTTRGHPGRWNDKTVVLFDAFVHGLKRGRTLSDATFHLLERKADGEIVAVKYRGSYVIVDNGYLPWSCTVPPFTRTVSRPHIRWSEWLESMRKDVECTFGIMKGRWRVLKTGIRLHGTDAADKTWATCCALHNWLLEVDGLDQPWDGALGDVDADDLENVPFALRRLASPAECRNYDTSGMGAGEEGEEVDGGEDGGLDEADEFVMGMETNVELVEEDGARDITKMSLAAFREKLVQHFDVKWRRHELSWPERREGGPVVDLYHR